MVRYFFEVYYFSIIFHLYSCSGSHSVKKSAATYLSGLLGGPNQIQINLRAGWSNGVRDHYIFSSPGSDAFVGRSLTTIDINSPTISVLPPHFAKDAVFHVAEEGDRDSFWRMIFPAYDEMPQSMRHCLPFWLASIIHHRAWLRETLPPGHIVLASPLFSRGHADRLAPLVQTGLFKNSETGLAATGVPPNANVQETCLGLSKQFSSLQSDFKHTNDIIAEQNARVISIIDNIPKRTQEAVMDVLEDPQRRQITPEDIERMFTDFASEIRQQISEGSRMLAQSVQSGAAASSTAETATAARPPSPQRPNFQAYVWGGSFHPVPEGFRLLTQSMHSMLGLWYWGDVVNNIGPFNRITGQDLTVDSDKVLLSRARIVFKKLPQPPAGVSYSVGFAPLSQAVEKAVKEIYAKLNAHREKKIRVFARVQELSIFTVYAKVLELDDVIKSSGAEPEAQVAARDVSAALPASVTVVTAPETTAVASTASQSTTSATVSAPIVEDRSTTSSTAALNASQPTPAGLTTTGSTPTGRAPRLRESVRKSSATNTVTPNPGPISTQITPMGPPTTVPAAFVTAVMT